MAQEEYGGSYTGPEIDQAVGKILNFDEANFIGPPGPAGPDGNPIGSIISFMGTTAPKDYLICDGAEYNVADYADLAAFFTTEFGSANYFGGDGTATFAVPDLRNLFLRGYRGESTEQLSGGIGEKQEATDLPVYGVGEEGNVNFVTYDLTNAIWPNNFDKAIGQGQIGRYVDSSVIKSWSTTLSGFPKTYTTRPVNMAVLYCIKAASTAGGVTMDQVNAAITAAITGATEEAY